MTDSSTTSHTITNGPVTLTSPAFSPQDDWSGLADAAERRRRQNRINQRARRLRQQRNSTTWTIESRGGPVDVHQATNGVFRVDSGPQTRWENVAPTSIETSYVEDLAHRDKTEYSLDVSTSNSFHSLSALITALSTQHPSNKIRDAVIRQIGLFYHSYSDGSPQCDHLLSLTRMNVHRAFISNMLLMGIDWEWMADDAISPVTMERPGFDLDALPSTLRPTSLQRTQIHHTWIDLFPLPVMRDNLLRAGDAWDDEDLCTDLMGFWEGSGTGPAGLMLWGEPSNPFNWEVTEGFLKKWGWIVRGCIELMLATNSWRAMRGERPLFRMKN